MKGFQNSMSNDFPIETTPSAVPSQGWTPTEYSDPGAPSAPRAQMERYITVIGRYKWLVLILTLVGTLAGFAASRTADLTYLAQTTLWIEQNEGSGEDSRGPIRSEELLSSYAWIELLRSYIVLDHVVEELRLFVVPGTPSE